MYEKLWLSMQVSKDIIIAHEIKEENEYLKAPVNDIEESVKRLRKSGLNYERIKEIIPKLFKSNETEHINLPRNPKQDEILIYTLPDKYKKIIQSPE